MTSSQDILTRIAALRTRLDRIHVRPGVAGVAGPHRAPVAPTQPRLTARAARLLHDARELLVELRALSESPEIVEEASVTAASHRRATHLLDVILRDLSAAPAEAPAQVRLCEGLQACLDVARDEIASLRRVAGLHRDDASRVAKLAGFLRAMGEPGLLAPDPLIELARVAVDDALRRAPLRWAEASPSDPTTFAAAHGWNVAQVMARVLESDIPNPQRLAETIAPALTHDVGMASLPGDLLAQPSPLADAERRTIEAHAAAGAKLVRRVWPGGGWPVDAAHFHHERADGSGYPDGRGTQATSDLVRLLAACDVYAALATPRPQRDARDPRTALADLLAMGEAGALDRAQTEKLLRLGFYPAGCVVRLSDGTLALVAAGRRAALDPAKSTVIPLRDASGAAPAHPWLLDLADAPDLTIVRALSQRERAQALGRTHPALV